MLPFDKIFKLFVITLSLCCLLTSVFGSELSVVGAKYNNTDMKGMTKTGVKAREIAAREKFINHKFSGDDVNHDDYKFDDHKHNDHKHNDHKHNDHKHNDHKHDDYKHDDHKHDDYKHDDHKYDDHKYDDHKHDDHKHHDHKHDIHKHHDHKHHDHKHDIHKHHDHKLDIHKHHDHKHHDHKHDDHKYDDHKYDDHKYDDEKDYDDDDTYYDESDSSLTLWGIVSGFWSWMKDDVNEYLLDDPVWATSAVEEGRTFGKIRRLQMALIPIVFKFGVLSAMVAFLVGLSIKTVLLVKVLVVMNLLALLAKFFTLKSSFGHIEHFSGPPAPMWSPYISTPDEHHLNKEIHLHIHGGHLVPQAPSYPYGSGTIAHTNGWEKRSDPYSAYDNIALQGKQNQLIGNELRPYAVNSAVSTVQQHARSFPDNHRMF